MMLVDPPHARSRRLALLALVGALLAFLAAQAATAPPPRPYPSLKLLAQEAKDQDDLCIWIHPTEPARSTIITSDKRANRIFVYDLEGSVLQVLPVPRPGNIDLRYGFSLNRSAVDLVAVNQRIIGPRILVFRIDPETRALVRVDDDGIFTDESTGGTLFRSPKDGKLYFVVTSDEDEGQRVQQYELFETPEGRVGGRRVRGWKLGSHEGAVGDDEMGKIYISEEDRGVWEVGGEPTDPTPGRLVIRVGEHGLRADVEGLTIYKRSASTGYLIVSNQSRDAYEVYSRGPAHEYLGHFTIAGGRATDGIDVTNVNLGPRFPAGFFGCHSEWFAPGASLRCPVLITPFEQVARTAGLEVDTSWDPRRQAVVAAHGSGVDAGGAKP